MIKIIYIFYCLVCANISYGGLLFNYAELNSKNVQQMKTLVEEKIKESKKYKNAKYVPLKEALQAVLSRPHDGIVMDSVLTQIRAELDAQLWEKAIRELTDEALGALGNPKKFRPNVQATYLYFLENVIAEFKPYVQNNGFETTIIKKISNSKLKLSESVISELKKNAQKEALSPSDLASQVIQ